MLRRLITTAVFSIVAVSAAQAQSADQTVTFTVSAINELVLAGAPSLTINSATAGSAPTSVSDATGSYDITTNETNRKITAALSAVMPTGLTLKITLGAPTGATSAGEVTLGIVAADVVTGISNVSESALNISYTLDATAEAVAQTNVERTVTLLITSGV